MPQLATVGTLSVIQLDSEGSKENLELCEPADRDGSNRMHRSAASPTRSMNCSLVFFMDLNFASLRLSLGYSITSDSQYCARYCRIAHSEFQRLNHPMM